jgi:DNA-binding XRE family transcriptional regulator
MFDPSDTGPSFSLGVRTSEELSPVARTFSGRQLRAHRVAAGLKPEALAPLVKRSVFTIHQYERGVALPSVPVLGALADALSVSVDDFFATEAVAADVA